MMNNLWCHFRKGWLGLMAVLCLLQICASPLAAEVKWWNAADPENKEALEAKIVVLYFNADWCSYCTKLKADVFSTEGFQALGDKAIFVAVDDKDDARSNRVDLEKKLKIESYPTLVVMKRSGDSLVEAGRVVGYYAAEEYLGHLRPLLGVENPPKLKLPDAIAGLGLTPDSNLCQPGDLQCIIGKTRTTGSPFSGFEDLLKPSTPEATTKTAGQVLTDESLAELIKALGYSGESISSSSGRMTTRFFQEEDGWKFPTDATLSSNQSKLWLTCSMGQIRPAAELPSGTLLKLLEFNNSYGPTHFSVANGNLLVARSIENVEVTKESVAYALSELRRASRETYGVWRELLPAPAP